MQVLRPVAKAKDYGPLTHRVIHAAERDPKKPRANCLGAFDEPASKIVGSRDRKTAVVCRPAGKSVRYWTSANRQKVDANLASLEQAVSHRSNFLIQPALLKLEPKGIYVCAKRVLAITSAGSSPQSRLLS